MSQDSAFDKWLQEVAYKRKTALAKHCVSKLFEYSKSLQQAVDARESVNDTCQYKRLADTLRAVLNNRARQSIESPQGLQDIFHEAINKPTVEEVMKSIQIDASMSKRNNVFVYRYSLSIDLRTCTDDDYEWYASQVAGLNELCVSTQDNNTTIPIHGSKGRTHVARVTARRTLCESKRTGDADGHKVHIAHTTFIVTMTLDANNAESFAAIHNDPLNSMESVLEIHRKSSTRRSYCVKGGVQYITVKRIPKDKIIASEVHQDVDVHWPSGLLDTHTLKAVDCPPFTIRPTNAQIETQKSAYEFENKRYFTLVRNSNDIYSDADTLRNQSRSKYSSLHAIKLMDTPDDQKRLCTHDLLDGEIVSPVYPTADRRFWEYWAKQWLSLPDIRPLKRRTLAKNTRLFNLFGIDEEARLSSTLPYIGGTISLSKEQIAELSEGIRWDRRSSDVSVFMKFAELQCGLLNDDPKRVAEFSPVQASSSITDGDLKDNE